jgi:hypothetical protein
MGNGPEDNEHTFPPPPMPPGELARYSPDRDPDSEQDIARYVELEAQDEKVQNVERIKTEIVAGEKYEIWDVHTDKERWWVITNLTNLYPHKYFPSMDFTLSLHIGLMMRMRSRPDRSGDSESSPFDEVFRRQEQAKQRWDSAVEPEDFQAVGVQLRECLLSLLPAMRRQVSLGADVVQPKAGDFIGWYNVLIDHLCGGGSNKELRQYLKGTARDTWQLVGWLVHDRDADKTAASIGIYGTDTIVGHSIQILERNKRGVTESCPTCKSKDIRSHYDPALGTGGEYYLTCGACRWSSHAGYEEDAEEDGEEWKRARKE